MSYRSNWGNNGPPCIFVGNLPEDITPRELQNIFGKFGEIRDIDIKTGKTTNYTAYAFIEFYHIRDAEDAVESRDGYSFDKYRLRVELSGRRRLGSQSNRLRRYDSYNRGFKSDYRLVVSNISPSVRYQDIKEHMRKAGPIGHVLVRDGTAIVEFFNKSDMKYALDKYDGSELSSGGKVYKIRVREENQRSPSYSDGRPLQYQGERRSRSHSQRRDGEEPEFDRDLEENSSKNVNE